MASWQHCIDYKTTSAGLSELTATPTGQVSGSSLHKTRKTSITKARPLQSTFPHSRLVYRIEARAYLLQNISAICTVVVCSSCSCRLLGISDLLAREEALVESCSWHLAVDPGERLDMSSRGFLSRDMKSANRSRPAVSAVEASLEWETPPSFARQ